MSIGLCIPEISVKIMCPLAGNEPVSLFVMELPLGYEGFNSKQGAFLTLIYPQDDKRDNYCLINKT